ncbi:MAG: S1/P1 Nuclease, partial [Alphaproteobacteria bacterium]
SEHHAGWGAYPDPMTYPPPGSPPEVKNIHNYFEGPFVRANVTPAAVHKAMTPYAPCGCAIEKRVPAYLETTRAQLMPLYEMVASGDIKNTTPQAVAFATARVAAGASEVRDEIEDAWKASATAVVGYPAINVADVESRKVILSRLSYGAD